MPCRKEFDPCDSLIIDGSDHCCGFTATEYTDRILEILAECPSGLTARDIANRLGVSSANMSSRLSKLAAYGIVAKTRGRMPPDGGVTGLYFVPGSDQSPPLDTAEPRTPV